MIFLLNFPSFAQCPQDEGELCIFGFDEAGQTYESEGVVNGDGEMVMALTLSNASATEFETVRALQIDIIINPTSTPVTINQTKTSNSLHDDLKATGWLYVQYPSDNVVRITGFSTTAHVDLSPIVDDLLKIYYTGSAGDCFEHSISGSWRFVGQQAGLPCDFDIPSGCDDVEGCFPFVTLSGSIKSYPNACSGSYDYGLEQVSVHIYDEDPSGSVYPVMTVETDEYGDYVATPLEPGFDYWVVPEKHDNPNCGLDMTDLAILQNHLISNPAISDNWAKFVANVNDVSTPNTLSIYDYFGLQWRIIDYYSYPHASFPRSWFFMRNEDWLDWIYYDNWSGSGVPPADEFYFLEDVTIDQSDLDFKAGKAGDIDPTCTDCTEMFEGDEEIAAIRHDNPAKLVQGPIHRTIDPSIVRIPFYMPDVRSNQIWLISLGFPFEGYIIDEVHPIGITDREHFNWNVQEKLEALSIIWSPSLTNATPLEYQLPAFEVQIRRLDGQNIVESPFFLKAHPAKDGVVEDPYNIRPWELIGEESLSQTDHVELRVFPNPAIDKVWLFASEAFDAGTFNLYDLYGRLVVSQALDAMGAGDMNRIEIAGLPNGFYQYVHSTTDRRQTGKLIIAK